MELDTPESSRRCGGFSVSLGTTQTRGKTVTIDEAIARLQVLSSQGCGDYVLLVYSNYETEAADIYPVDMTPLHRHKLVELFE